MPLNKLAVYICTYLLIYVVNRNFLSHSYQIDLPITYWGLSQLIEDDRVNLENYY